jgi:hypothetical protein
MQFLNILVSSTQLECIYTLLPGRRASLDLAMGLWAKLPMAGLRGFV